jgi:chitodextrinase
VDSIPPVISGITVNATDAQAVIGWTTDEPSVSQISYTDPYGATLWVSDPTLRTSHTLELSGLEPGTTYTYEVFAADKDRNVSTSGPLTFTTQSTAPTSEPYIMSWLVDGHFSNPDQLTRLTADYIGGESLAFPREGMVSGGRTWSRSDSPTEYLDLNAMFGSPTYCAAYAHAYVYSPAAQTVNMWMGSNDGIKVWLNGNVVWFNDAYRSFRIDKDKTTVNLSAGWNRLLVKVSQATGSWGVSVKLCDSAGNPIPGLIYNPTP